MTEGYDPSHSITVPSTHLMGSFTHAALYITSGNTDARLYVVDPSTSLSNKSAQYAYGRPVDTVGPLAGRLVWEICDRSQRLAVAHRHGFARHVGAEQPRDRFK